MKKKIYESAGIRIVTLDCDLLITSGGTLGEMDWDVVEFGWL